MSSSTFVPLRSPQSSSIHAGTVPSSSTSSLTTDIHNDRLRSQFGIEVEGINIPGLIENFHDMQLPNRCLHFLKETKKFLKPTPVQMQAMNCILNHRDCICLSSTGTGKTHAYLLPLCFLLWKNKILECTTSPQTATVLPVLLILVPTRELMSQLRSAAEELVSVFMQTNARNETPHYNPSNYELMRQERVPIRNMYGSIRTQYNSLHHGHNIFLRNSQINFQNGPCFSGPEPPPMQTNQRQVNNSFYGTRFTTQNGHADFRGNYSVVNGICGGVPIREQLEKLSCHTKIIVSTPGRLLDLYDRHNISLGAVKYFVIDECDKMLEMGLEEQLRSIVAKVTVNKTSIQTSLWSATLPDSLERLARSAVVNPVYVCTGVKDIVPKNIVQSVLFMHSYLKQSNLLNVLRKTPYPPVIVFVSAKDKADELEEFLQREQFHAAAIHSGKAQPERDEIMKDFRENVIDVLLATDVISRGLDLPAVTHVINFDTPDNIQDYIHRCGRTGRFGRAGLATTFVTLRCKIAKELKDLLEATNNEIPPELMDAKMFGKKVISTDMGDRII